LVIIFYLIPESSIVEKQTKKITKNINFSCLPQIITFQILEFITKPELISISTTCKLWYSTSKLNVLWKNFDFEGFNVNSFQEGVEFLNKIFHGQTPIMSLRLPSRFTKLTAKDFKKLRSISKDLKELKFPSIQNSSLSINNGILKEIACFSNLKKLDVSTHVSITDEGIENLTKNQTKLTYITLDNCSNITEATILSIVRNCPNIQGISALYCQNCNISSQTLLEISEKLKKLKILKVQFGDVSSLAVEKFVESFEKFEEIHFKGFYSLNGNTLTKITQELKGLKKLTITCNESTKIISADISNESLVSFSIGTLDHMKYTTINSPNLKSLQFDNIHLLESISSEHLNLNEVYFRGCFLKDVNFNHLNSKNVELFDCTGLQEMKLQNEKLQDLNLFMCPNLKNLEISSEAIKTFTIDSCMQLLNISLETPNLEKSQLFCLPQDHFPLLKNFYLKSEKIESLALQRCVNLSSVSLNCSNLNALNLGECKILENLELKCEKLKKIALSAPQLKLTKEYISNLSTHCKYIEMMSLSNVNSLTDEILSEIASTFNHLQAMIISNCDALKNTKIISQHLKGLQITECSNLEYLGLLCPNLAKLILKKIPLKDESFRYFGVQNLRLLEILQCNALENPVLKFSQLTNLKMEECNALKEPSIASLFLKQIQISSCSLSFIHFPIENVHLFQIQLENCNFLKDSMIEHLLNKTPNLLSLLIVKNNSLESPLISSNSLQNLSLIECRELKNVKISQETPLKSLSFRSCSNLLTYSGKSSKIEFIECNQLKELSLMDSEVSTIVSCQELKNLRTTGKTCVASCSSLEKIHFSGEWLDVKECNNLTTISSEGGLKSIQLCNCRKISDESLANILLFQHLSSLVIENCSIVSPIVKHSTLSKFHLRRCFYLIDIQTECPCLEEFEIYDIPNLNLKNLNKLNKNSELHKLVKFILRGTKFDFENFKDFLKYKTKESLKELQITGVTVQQKKELKQIRQDVEVY
jgi:uncharacterized protein YjbI with pentapeptide repeats